MFALSAVPRIVASVSFISLLLIPVSRGSPRRISAASPKKKTPTLLLTTSAFSSRQECTYVLDHVHLPIASRARVNPIRAEALGACIENTREHVSVADLGVRSLPGPLSTRNSQPNVAAADWR